MLGISGIHEADDETLKFLIEKHPQTAEGANQNHPDVILALSTRNNVTAILKILRRRWAWAALDWASTVSSLALRTLRKAPETTSSDRQVCVHNRPVQAMSDAGPVVRLGTASST